MAKWFGFSISTARARPKRGVRILTLCLLAVALVVPQHSLAETFHTVKGLLSSHFAQAEKVSYRRLDLNAQQLNALQERLKSPLSKRQWVFYRAERGGAPIGYALFDSEKGQHEPMDLATFFDNQGKVTRVELVAFREPYGDGVKAERFRQQFVGRTAQSGFVAGIDIDTISGATLSSRAMAKAVHRAALLLDLGLRQGAIESSTAASTTP